jgi:hypothetical protein
MMNPLQKPADFSRTVFEINQNAFKEILGSQKDNIQKYFELNSSFSKKLPEEPQCLKEYYRFSTYRCYDLQ